jgi:isopentenyl diphosphate isomerase/L-lactate dehydrogenase-like FMN-dependent dehydrogenase
MSERFMTLSEIKWAARNLLPPSVWGLAVDGAAGVHRTFQLLHEEMATAMRLCGQTSVRGLTPDLIHPVDHWPI